MAWWVHDLGIALQFVLLLGAVLLASCSGSSASESAEPHDRSESASGGDPDRPYRAIEVVNGGTITGVVSWIGPRPEVSSVPVADLEAGCGSSISSPALEVSQRGGISGTVVWIEGIGEGRAIQLPAEPAPIDVQRCAIEPHVLAVPVGARVVFRNDDDRLHNVHATFWGVRRAGDTWFSHGLPERDTRHEVVVSRGGIVRLLDDAGCPWLSGWLHAFDHPYFATSDGEGRFRLIGVPPGQYVLRAWHEGFLPTGATESGRVVYSAPIALARPITVSTGHDTAVDFVIGLDAAVAAGE